MSEESELENTRAQFFEEHRALSLYLTKLAVMKSRSAIIRLRFIKIFKHFFGGN